MTNFEEIRTKVVFLTAAINNMCNATTTEAVQKCCVEAKDLLIELYKANITRVSKES